MTATDLSTRVGGTASPSDAQSSSSSNNDRVLGTLVVVVIRAKNLTNRVRIGKQNPYATVTYGLNKKRTETIERGGQQPTWDTEFRFEILKDSSEQLAVEGKALVNKHGGVMPVLGNTGDAASTKLQQQQQRVTSAGTGASSTAPGKKTLRLACYADDPKDPRLVGEGTLDLEPILKKGAFDDWVTLERKGRYAGQIYLELTWYSREPPPGNLQRAQKSDSYGGPGSRTEDVSDDDQGTQEWDDDSDVGQSSSTGTHEIAADYPDPDLAPLSNRMSMMQLGNRPPLPAPPNSAPANLGGPQYGYEPARPYDQGTQYQHPMYAHDNRYGPGQGYGEPRYLTNELSEFGGYGGPETMPGLHAQQTIRASTYAAQPGQSITVQQQYGSQGHVQHHYEPQPHYAQQDPSQSTRYLPPPPSVAIQAQYSGPQYAYALPQQPPQPPATPSHWQQQQPLPVPPQPPQPPMRPVSSNAQYGPQFMSSPPVPPQPPAFAPPPTFAPPPPHPSAANDHGHYDGYGPPAASQHGAQHSSYGHSAPPGSFTAAAPQPPPAPSSLSNYPQHAQAYQPQIHQQQQTAIPPPHSYEPAPARSFGYDPPAVPSPDAPPPARSYQMGTPLPQPPLPPPSSSVNGHRHQPLYNPYGYQ